MSQDARAFGTHPPKNPTNISPPLTAGGGPEVGRGDQWYSSGLSPLVVQRSDTGGNQPGKPKSPDFGPFALEIWTRNTPNFPGAAKKERNEGDKPEEYH